MFFSAYSFINKYRELLVKSDTNLVIEGFPRSGNTFAVVAFESAQDGNIKIAHHLHASAQVFRAVEMGLPVCVLIRQPIDAIKSLLIREPHLLPITVLKGYVEFYSDIIEVKDKLLIATFDEVTTDFGKVVERINKKFNKQYKCFEHTPRRVDEIFEKIQKINDIVDGGKDETVAIPNKNKEAIKIRLVFTDLDLVLLDQANEIYNLVLQAGGNSE